MAICPGQDTRYWRPEDVFEIPCGHCARALEFFKDDVRRRCPGCGQIVQNPKITMGCAQWCEHAKACLGYDPKEMSLDESEQGSRWQQLADAADQLHQGDASRLLSQTVAEEAQRLLDDEPARRPVVLAAALLHLVPGTPQEQREAIAQILAEIALDRATVDEVCDLVAASDSAVSPEAQVFHDARHLAALRLDGPQAWTPPTTWYTKGGRRRARELQDRPS
jgi:hypothetical protein